jgi:hypothetical protein
MYVSCVVRPIRSIDVETGKTSSNDCIMRTSILSRLASAVVLVGSLVACSDQPTATTAPNEKVTILGVTDFQTYQVVDFTVDQEGGWFNVGPHYVYFPANSICDPAKSTYGPTEWDKPCSVINAPIKIRAEIQNSLTTGKPAIRFWPDLRFAPVKTNGRQKPNEINSKWVMLYMFTEEALKADTEAEAALLEQKFKILWTPVTGGLAVDESIKDGTLATRVLAKYGVVYRRVKHFSGYQVGSGVSYGEEQF